MAHPTPPVALVAREREVAALEAVLAEGRGGLVLQGEPGIGKTSLWELGLTIGREQGFRVLSARPGEAESGLSFAALSDLLDEVGDDELAVLPAPQRHALGVALYREEPTGDLAGPHPVSLGLLGTLRSLSSRQPVLVAVDDVQWLDRASDDALAYAVRRLAADPVTVLLARRPGTRSAVEGALTGEHQVRVDGISLGATRHVLADRLGLRLPHHVLRRVYDVTLGNPFFALEVGRVLARRDLDTLGEDVPVPDHVEDLLGLRIADLEPVVRRVLLALALDADLRVGQLERLCGRDGLDRAVEEGVVVTDGERVRPSHPLLAAAANRQAPDASRRDLHRALADVVGDEQHRVHHLARATLGEDDRLAERLAAASRSAAARGAARLAVELGSHALRLTPTRSPHRVTRLLELGRLLVVAGERQWLTDLLTGEADALPTPADRVGAHLLLMQGAVPGNDGIRRHLDRALQHAGDDPGLRARVLVEMAENDAVVAVTQVARADERAAEAVALGGAPEAHRHALTALAWTSALRGRPVDDLCRRHRALSEHRVTVAQRPERIAAQRLVWRGEVEPAHALLETLRAEAGDAAEPSSYALVRLHLCELWLRTGASREAQLLLDEWGSSADDRLLSWPMYERCRALLAAGRGDQEDARRWASTALARAETTGVEWDRLEVERALGLVALLAKDWPEAVGHLGAVWDHTEREGVLDPGAFPVAPDLVEALVEGEDLARARSVTRRLSAQARDQQHPWALAGARRSAALLGLATAYDAGAAGELDAVARTYAELGLAHEGARTLLASGRAARRARKWGAARDALERAVDGFDATGSPGWAAEARSELSRVGARRPTSPGLLTATERRVAALAVAGLANKEIARTLVVTVNTVEFHLRNVYAKLGIRSRMQLAGRLAEEGIDLGD
jgi:DNA-binding CsgD family transcriptional regulator